MCTELHTGTPAASKTVSDDCIVMIGVLAYFSRSPYVLKGGRMPVWPTSVSGRAKRYVQLL
jgi:hypothetical protein